MSEPKAAGAGFAGAARWLTAPSHLGSAGAAVVVLAYAAATLSVSARHAPLLLAIALLVGAAGTAVAWVGEQRGLRTLRRLGEGKAEVTEETLGAAAREVAALADRTFWQNVSLWSGGALFTTGVFCLWTGARWPLVARGVLVGAGVGALAAAGSYILVVLRSRALITRLAEAGLNGEQLSRELPPLRLALRSRLVGFVGIAVMVPTLLVTDVLLVDASEAYEGLLALAPGAAQHVYVAQRSLTGAHLAGLWLCGLVGLLAIGASFLVGSALARPLQAISEEAQRIARGELKVGAAIVAEDEIWAASSAFMTMEAQLAHALRQLEEAGERIASTTEQLVASSSKHEAGAAQQASALNETSATTEELARSARQIAENAAEVAKIAEQTLAAAQGGRTSSDTFATSMARMKSDNQVIADSVVKLNKRVQQIGKVVEFIHDIADKSDLLALNAELEGTKAGQVGRGFSLVAAEMRRLAESVIRSTREIELLIDEIRDATNAAVMATEAGVKATDAGAGLATQISEKLRSVLELAASTSEAVRSISLATQQQQTGTDQLAEAMGGILTVTYQGAEATRQILGANSDLLAVSRELQSTAAHLQVGVSLRAATGAGMAGERTVRQRLRGQALKLANANGFAGVGGAALAVLYGSQTLELGAALNAFVWLGMSAAVPISLIAIWRALRPLRTLRELAAGKTSPSVDALQAAAAEVYVLPDFTFRVGLQHWFIGATLVAVALKLFAPAVTLTSCVRILGIGLVFGLVTSLFAYFLVLIRGRKVTARLVELGLTGPALIAALPPTRRQLRRRLALFMAIAVLCPAALAADLSITRTGRALAQTAAAPAAQQRARVQQAMVAAVTGAGSLTGVVLLLAVLTALSAGSAIVRPMREIAEEARRIAQGKVSTPKAILAEDEVWAVSAAFTGMQAHLGGVLGHLRSAGMQIGSTTELIVATSHRYEGGAAEQATSLNQTSATTEELARSAAQIAANATSVAEIASLTLTAAVEGQGSAQVFAVSMERMHQDNEAINESVLKLSKRVQQIGRIVEFINAVADKSDLLALNAELEGTKAGEVGRGFQLVASEMRRLAENVIESTKEIEGLIEEIREATRATVQATEAGMDTTVSSAEVAGNIIESLTRIVEMAELTSTAVKSISLATQQQQSGTDQLADAMADILKVTQTSQGATRQVTSANQDLVSLAKDLQTVVERFEA